MNEIKTVDLDSVPVLLASASKIEWTILRIDPSSINLSTDFIQQVTTLSEQVSFIKKDPGTYGEFYEGVSLQYSNRDSDTQDRKNSASVMAKAIIDRYDHHLKKTIYYTGKGFSLDKPVRGKEPQLVNLEKRPDLQEILKTASLKDNIVSYFFLNSWASIFKNFILQFADKKMVVYYGRLLRTLPGQTADIHSDRDVRIHIPIYTNDQCITSFYTKDKKLIGSYHMPADGSIYLFNSHPLHDFCNNGTTSRLHAIFSVDNVMLGSWFKEFSSVDEILKAQKHQFNNLGN